MRRLALTACILAGLPGSAAARDSLPDVAVYRDHARRFTVVGANRVWCTHLMRWAELVLEKTENLVGLPMPAGSIDIDVLGRADGNAHVSWSQAFRDGALVRQLTIHDYATADVAQAETGLCELLLNGYAAAFQRVAPGAPPPAPVRVPRWLAVGAARNLYPAFRAENAAHGIALWERAAAPSVAQILREDAAPAPEVCGLFVDWLRDQPDRAALFRRLFARVGSRQPTDAAWLVTALPSVEDGTALQHAWDAWILRQKRVVFRPGTVTERAIQQLKSALLITPHSAAADPEMSRGPLTPQGLIALRAAPGAAAAARDKAARLRVRFIGRGDAFARVVEAYARFFEAVAEDRDERRLRELLKKAATALEELEKTL